MEQLFENMTIWMTSITCYIGLALASFIPVVKAMLKKVKLHPGGESFSESTYFTDSNKKLLKQHFTRLHGTLVFWKNKVEWHKRFHYYTLFWTIPISILIPIITQIVEKSFASKLFSTIISTLTAFLIAFHRALKIENNYKAFRSLEGNVLRRPSIR